MRAIFLDNGRIRYCDQAPMVAAADDEIVVSVALAGICETDLQLSRGYLDFTGVLGHEFVGTAQSGRFAGQRVVGEINCNCRQCVVCRSGLGNHCPTRTVVGIDGHDGAFADYVAIPEHRLHRVPDAIDDDQAVFIEPLAAALQVAEQVPLGESQQVAVLGDGRLGFLCTQVAIACGARVMVVGKHVEKLQRYEHLDCRTILLSAVDSERSFDVVIDCTGSNTGLPLALRLVRPRGTIVMKTTIAAKHELSLASIVVDEISLVGSRCGPFEKAIDALAGGDVDVTGLITHRFDLSAAEQAFDAAVQPDACKVVFEING